MNDKYGAQMSGAQPMSAVSNPLGFGASETTMMLPYLEDMLMLSGTPSELMDELEAMPQERLLGIVSLEIYEGPCALDLHAALQGLEGLKPQRLEYHAAPAFECFTLLLESPCFSSVRTLQMPGLGDVHAFVLRQARPGHLRTLRALHGSLTGVGVRHISMGLPGLTRLALAGQKRAMACAESVHFLEDHESLEELDIRDTGLNHQGLYKLQTLSFPHLKTLRLSTSKFDLADAVGLVRWGREQGVRQMQLESQEMLPKDVLLKHAGTMSVRVQAT